MGATIALGSQMWNGTSALLAAAPSTTPATITPASGPSARWIPGARSGASSVVPATWPIATKATKRRSPGAVVMAKACSAASRGRASWRWRPMSRKELTLVASQKR